MKEKAEDKENRTEEAPPPPGSYSETRVRPEPRKAEIPGSPDGLVGSVVADRYLVHDLLGRGGMGEVYLAEHVHMKKRVALKVLHGDLSTNDDVVKRFEREAIAAARINHPSVVTATDFGPLPDGSFYLVLEFIEGVSLSEELSRVGAMDAQRTFGILFQMVAALEAAHGAGIVHRDLKPDNVMLVASSDEDDYVKVLDFGIAKIQSDFRTKDTSSPLTRAGMIFGTPEYMAPEQAQGGEVDERADLYALGMIGYELLTGKTAFFDEDLVTVLKNQILSPPEPLPESVPKPLADVVMSLLAKEPSERPASASIVLKTLFDLAEREGWPLPEPKTRVGTKIDLRASRGFIPGTFSLDPGKIVMGPLESLRSLSMLPVKVGPKSVPLWLPLLALVVGVSLGGFFVHRSRQSAPTETREVIGPVEIPWPSLEAAAAGDRDVLGELRKRLDAVEAEGALANAPEAKRAFYAEAYFCLGRGLAKIHLATSALRAFESSLALDAKRANDERLFADLASALDDREASEAAIRFAVARLGSLGPDLVYDALRRARTKSATSAAVTRFSKALRQTELRSAASPELRTLLDLERARVCAEFRQIFQEPSVKFDSRSVTKLEALLNPRGCGRKGAEDCYRCLREGTLLEDSLAAAKKNVARTLPAPPGG